MQLQKEIRKTVLGLRESGFPITTFPPAYEVIEHLKRMGWIQPVEAQSAEGGSTVEFLIVTLGSEQHAAVSPLELLQAWMPGGTICYFTAIAYHELTTQVAAHHHIGRLVLRPSSKEAVPQVKTEKASEPIERNPLGTEVFSFAEVPYYVTRRDVALTPGIQMRVISSRTWIRITTLEQTLLDCLMQPLRCGGEAVVLEAWERGVKEMDTERMAEHLSKIKRQDLDRRVGAILDLTGANVAATSLGTRLQSVRDCPTMSTEEIPLLPGLQFESLNAIWKVRAP